MHGSCLADLRPCVGMSKRVGGLQTDWQVMADGFANVFVKYNHTALQLQAAQEDPDTDCAVCLHPSLTLIISTDIAVAEL